MSRPTISKAHHHVCSRSLSVQKYSTSTAQNQQASPYIITRLKNLSKLQIHAVIPEASTNLDDTLPHNTSKSKGQFKAVYESQLPHSRVRKVATNGPTAPFRKHGRSPIPLVHKHIGSLGRLPKRSDQIVILRFDPVDERESLFRTIPQREPPRVPPSILDKSPPIRKHLVYRTEITDAAPIRTVALGGNLNSLDHALQASREQIREHNQYLSAKPSLPLKGQSLHNDFTSSYEKAPPVGGAISNFKRDSLAEIVASRPQRRAYTTSSVSNLCERQGVPRS